MTLICFVPTETLQAMFKINFPGSSSFYPLEILLFALLGWDDFWPHPLCSDDFVFRSLGLKLTTNSESSLWCYSLKCSAGSSSLFSSAIKVSFFMSQQSPPGLLLTSSSLPPCVMTSDCLMLIKITPFVWVLLGCCVELWAAASSSSTAGSWRSPKQTQSLSRCWRQSESLLQSESQTVMQGWVICCVRRAHGMNRACLSKGLSL